MSTVLALSVANIDAHPVAIRECHINLWILPAFLGKRYQFDIGFFLRNIDNMPVDEIQLVVPLASPDAAQCLVSHMDDKAPEAWETVFGRKPPDAQTRTRTILERIGITELRTHSCWSLKLTQIIKPNTERYLRVRFSSYNQPACIDTFGGWLGLGARLRLDLRLFDYHELADFRGLPQDFNMRLIPIQHSYVYLVAPQVNRPELYSPPFTYIRILEDPLWRGYLGRRPSLLRRRTRKMHVFAWKRQSDDQAAVAAHRVFSTFIPRGLPSTMGRVLSVGCGIVALSAAALALLYPLIHPATAQKVTVVPVIGFTWWKVSGISAVVVFILSLPRLVGWVSTWARWMQNARSWADEKLYAIRD